MSFTHIYYLPCQQRRKTPPGLWVWYEQTAACRTPSWHLSLLESGFPVAPSPCKHLKFSNMHVYIEAWTWDGTHSTWQDYETCCVPLSSMVPHHGTCLPCQMVLWGDAPCCDFGFSWCVLCCDVAPCPGSCGVPCCGPCCACGPGPPGPHADPFPCPCPALNCKGDSQLQEIMLPVTYITKSPHNTLLVLPLLFLFTISASASFPAMTDALENHI